MAPLTIEDPAAEARLQQPREFALMKTLSGSDSEVLGDDAGSTAAGTG